MPVDAVPYTPARHFKDELGWADFQVRSDIAIRHQVLVNCAFSFCWDAWFADHVPHHDAAPLPKPGRGERGPPAVSAPPPSWPRGDPGSPRVAFPLDRTAALVGRLVQSAPAPPAASPDRLGRGRLRPASLHPELTNYR